jgi:hypothetical protein
MEQTESDFSTEDYEAHQTAQDAAYAAEYRRWVSTLSEADRQRLTLDGILEPDCNIRATSCGGGGTEIDIALISGGAGRENGERVPTMDAPMPEGTDFDQLREMGLSAAQAAAVEAWISRRDADRVNGLAADRLARFFSLLLPPHSAHKINLHLLGLRSLAALFLANRNGTMTLTSLAERASESKQLLAHHARRLEDALGGFHGMGQKRESARATYAEAAKQRWASLTPEERIARRRGEKGIIGTAQSATPAAQFDNSDEVK